MQVKAKTKTKTSGPAEDDSHNNNCDKFVLNGRMTKQFVIC